MERFLTQRLDSPAKAQMPGLHSFGTGQPDVQPQMTIVNLKQ